MVEFFIEGTYLGNFNAQISNEQEHNKKENVTPNIQQKEI